MAKMPVLCEKSRLDDQPLLSNIAACPAWARCCAGPRFLTYEIFFWMDAPPAVCSLGRFFLRATWRDNRAGAGTSDGSAARASHHPLDRRGVHGPRHRQQGTHSRANEDESGPAIFE